MNALFPTLIFTISRLATALAASPTCADPSALVPLLRSFSGATGDHFYTTNLTENNVVAIAEDGYSFEGEAAFVWTTQQPGTIPLFRLFNPQENDHFYTMSSDEVPLMISLGWAYDTTPNHTAGYVYPYSICGASPIYRLFNPTSVDHFYTMDIAESIAAVQSGYQDQGIAGYAVLPSVNGTFVPGSATPFLLPTSVSASAAAQASSSICASPSDATPLLRAYSGSASDHFYTTNSTEMNNALTASYAFEGDAAFVWTSQEGSTVPLYRLFSQSLNDHFYTVDPTEANNSQSSGYAYDTPTGIAGYVYPYSVCGASPIYRMYSDAGKDHFYTMSITESENAPGWVIEGIAGYALLSSPDGSAQTVTASASPLFLPVETASATSVQLTLVPSGIPAATTSFGTGEFSPTITSNSSSSSHTSSGAAVQKPMSFFGALSITVFAVWALS